MLHDASQSLEYVWFIDLVYPQVLQEVSQVLEYECAATDVVAPHFVQAFQWLSELLLYVELYEWEQVLLTVGEETYQYIDIALIFPSCPLPFKED